MSDLIVLVGPVAATFAVAILSAVVPFIYIEVYLLAAVALVPGGFATWTLGVVAAIGQMVGKSALYWSARGVTSLEVRRRNSPETPGALRQRIAAMNPATVNGFTFAAALVGFPPFILVAPAAGAAAIHFWPFVLAGFAGRVLRFTVLVIAAAEIQRWIGGR